MGIHTNAHIRIVSKRPLKTLAPITTVVPISTVSFRNIKPGFCNYLNGESDLQVGTASIREDIYDTILANIELLGVASGSRQPESATVDRAAMELRHRSFPGHIYLRPRWENGEFIGGELELKIYSKNSGNGIMNARTLRVRFGPNIRPKFVIENQLDPRLYSAKEIKNHFAYLRRFLAQLANSEAEIQLPR